MAPLMSLSIDSVNDDKVTAQKVEPGSTNRMRTWYREILKFSKAAGEGSLQVTLTVIFPCRNTMVFVLSGFTMLSAALADSTADASLNRGIWSGTSGIDLDTEWRTSTFLQGRVVSSAYTSDCCNGCHKRDDRVQQIRKSGYPDAGEAARW